MTTYYDILDLIKSHLDDDEGVNTVTHGVVDKAKESSVSPFLGNDNETDVLNTQLAVVNRLMELLRRTDTLNVLDGSPTAEPFTERFENYLAGWALSFDIVIPNDMTIC